MGKPISNDTQHFKDLEEVASYIGEPLPQFLQRVQKGKFPINPRPIGPNVYHRRDLDLWLAAGRPTVMNTRSGFVEAPKD